MDYTIPPLLLIHHRSPSPALTPYSSPSFFQTSIKWRRAKLKGLGYEASSFLWKLLHQLLPTEERLARILPNTSPVCKICSTPTHADLIHCFFQCSSTRVMGAKLLSLFAVHDPLVTPSKLLRLDFQSEASMKMPLVWISSQLLLYMWGV